MEAFIGSWQLQSCDQLEELMDAYEIPEEAKPVFRRLDGVWTYESAADNKWKMGLDMGGNKKELIFSLGEALDDKDVLGAPLKTIITLENDRLVETYDFIGHPEKNYSMAFKVNGDVINQTICIKGLEVHCVLKKIA